MSNPECPRTPARAVLTRRHAMAVGGALGGGSLLSSCGSDAGSGSSGASLTSVSDVPVGSAVVVTNESGSSVVVAQPTEGNIVAFSGLCTHQGCAVVLATKTEVDCPCHGSRFDALTGKVLTGPATKPLDPYTVSVDGGDVVSAADQ